MMFLRPAENSDSVLYREDTTPSVSLTQEFMDASDLTPVSVELFLSLIHPIICHHTNPTLPVRPAPGTNCAIVSEDTRSRDVSCQLVVLVVDREVMAQS